MSDGDSCRDDEEKCRRSSAVNELKDIAEDGGRSPEDISKKKLERFLQSLTSQRRRYILYEMQENEVNGIDSLATSVTAMVQKVPEDEVDTEAVERMRAQLMHSELPMLADAGLIEYDQRSKAVRYSDPHAVLDTVLQLCANIDAPRNQ
ncbi:DUF7344 domain-containing protein [Natrarchaeobius chitinivorans]|uniref:DUF7344 domain-containing protein n=1 Tax=Natrarchaeobius chitinivorans TaxID=1679083 RepID=UPI000F545A23|nr:hypothetical protein [Natrarchaeobius chitinivorans]